MNGIEQENKTMNGIEQENKTMNGIEQENKTMNRLGISRFLVVLMVLFGLAHGAVAQHVINDTALTFLTTGEGVSTSGGDISLDINGTPQVTLRGGNTFLGLGTTLPSQRMHLYSATTGSTRMRIETLEGYIDLFTNDGHLQVLTNGTSRMIVRGGTGRVGIGTVSPTKMLDVVGDGKFSGDATFGGNATVGDIMSAAVVEIRGTGNDLAESFKVNAEAKKITSGMVVSIDPKNPGEMILSEGSFDRKVAGIISGAGDLHAGIHLGDIRDASEGYHPVALTGRVWCHVDPNSPAITPGDFLTTAALPGHAAKVQDFASAQGAVIGKAMTATNKETGMVLVLVSLQ
ncbi:MAG TPA: hypothetical protein EYN96_08305 [Candidatus Hydrogenedentes bacterium]|nr:hypothetical protein [Candidatus Hydrogenedentota bacterium]